MQRSKQMSIEKSTYEFIAQAETLLIYGIFLFLTGLAQIGVTIGHRYIIEQSINQEKAMTINEFLINLFSLFSMVDIHQWYIYPSAAWTIVPCVFCVSYAIFKRQWIAILISISSVISFIASSIYVGLLIIHTLEYWQTLSSYRLKNFQSGKLQTTTSATMNLLVPFDEPATFTNLALLITFTLSLVQSLLSLIGAVISCLWSPCCFTSAANIRTPISNNSYSYLTTSNRNDNPASSTIRSLRRSQQQMGSHRFSANESNDPMLSGLLHKVSPIRCNYDEV